METGEPARKRPRNDSDEEEKSADAPDIEDVTPTTRDETYYSVDGDCAIRVGDVLFKVHRYLLVRDSAVFADMFSMPQGNGTTSQMVTDENPVILHHDEVADFRALCWSIYALPTEFMDQADETKVDIPKLASLYLIAQKYQFESHERFARNLLKTHSSDITNKSIRIQEYFTTCSQRRLFSLLKIALLAEDSSSDSSLASYLQKAWLFRLEQRPEDSIYFALNSGESLGLRNFMAQVYYYELSMSDRHRIQDTVAYAPPVQELTTHQKLAFYQGYWSLQSYWADLMLSPRKKFKCPSTEPHNCNRLWKEFWPKYKLDIAGARFDPLHLLKIIPIGAIAMNKRDGFQDANISCILSYVNDIIKELEDSLADHFMDPVSSEATVITVETNSE